MKNISYSIKKQNNDCKNYYKKFESQASYKDITLVLTLFNPSKKEMDYWENFYLKLKNISGNMHFVIDNKKGVNISNKIDKKDIFFDKNNLGKLRRVINHVENNVKTTYFKTVDPDDEINFKKFEKIKIPNEKLLIICNGYISADNNKVNTPQTFWTASTILPTEGIKKNNSIFFKEIINYSEDQILASICLRSGAYPFHIKKPFYIHKFNNGVSNGNLYKNIDEFIIIFTELINNKEKFANRHLEALWLFYSFGYLKAKIKKLTPVENENNFELISNFLKIEKDFHKKYEIEINFIQNEL